MSLVTALWQATGSLRPEQSRDLCSALGGLSLLELDSARGGRVRLHDVIRETFCAAAWVMEACNA